MIARAIKRFERVSPRKVKRMLDVIKGKGVVEARATLQFHHSPTRVQVLKILNSAVANLKSTIGAVRVDDSDLFVKEARADAGPMMKRWRAGFRGGANMIRRRTCHITVVIDSYKPLEQKKGE